MAIPSIQKSTIAAGSIQNPIVDKIRKRMKEIGINARQLAEKSHVGKSFIYDILKEKSKNPTSSKLNSVARELGLSISYLMNNNDHLNYEDYIPIYRLEHDKEVHKEVSILLSKSFEVKRRLQEENNDLFSYRMYDNSMEPLIFSNETVIIQKETNKSIKSGIFLIKDQITSTIRRLEHIIGTTDIRIIPENDKYTTYTKNINEIEIVGKVVFSLKEF